MKMKRWLPVLVWMAAIFIVSNQPSTTLPHFGLIDLLVKKCAHFLAYALLAWLVQRAWGSEKTSWGWALLITAVYAISDEYHQAFVPGRFSSVGDIFIDVSGGLTALLLSHWRTHNQYTVSHNRLSDNGSRLTSHDSLNEAQSAQTTPVDGP